MELESKTASTAPLQQSSTLKAFCDRHSISKTMWRKLQMSGRGPQFYRLGAQKILITADAETAWLKARQNPPQAEAEMIQTAVEGLKAQSRRAVAKAMASGKHNSVKRREAAKNKAGA